MSEQIELWPVPAKIRKPPEPSYEITDHCCLKCSGRLLRRRLFCRKPSFEVVCAKCENKTLIADDILSERATQRATQRKNSRFSGARLGKKWLD